MNWVYHEFSLESVEETTDLAYIMYKIKQKEFSILPLHIIYYVMRPDNFGKTFKEINKEIGEMLGKMCKKYPPNDKFMSKSAIHCFNVQW